MRVGHGAEGGVALSGNSQPSTTRSWKENVMSRSTNGSITFTYSSQFVSLV